ncbi:MAG: response regulator transcription factor [Chitinophagaceae bacterium]|nr:response regulator transcription factor [Chitinophagaceae bacterium]
MINTIIIEDEQTAADNLIRLLKLTKEPINIIAVLDSVHESIAWLGSNPQPDLIFMDIQLKDGNSFSIFEKISISAPIVFITAFDNYLVNAFEQNSIEFLLKPIDEVAILHTINKYKNLKQHFIHRYKEVANKFKPKRTRIIVKKGIEYQSILLDDIAYFFTEHKITFLVTKEEKKFMLDQNLKELEEELDPQKFYQANRKFIINIDCIKSYKTFEKVKLSLDLRIPVNEDIVISQESAPYFKKWISEV